MTSPLAQAGLIWITQGLANFIADSAAGAKSMVGVGDSADGVGPKFSAMSGVIIGAASAVTSAIIDMSVKGIKAMVGLASESVNMAKDFQGAAVRLNIAGGVEAQAAAENFGGLSEIALAVGDDTRLMGVTASGAAQALTNLLKANVTLTEAMGDTNAYMKEGAMLGGVLGASINLAAATELDMVQASDFASITMSQFGLTAEGVASSLDYFVRSANASVMDVSELKDSLVNVGPVARGFGFTAEETADALALLSNAGIRGASAGTALKSMLSNLTKPSKKVTAALTEQGIVLTKNNGDYLDFAEIMAQVSVAMDGMTEAECTNFASTIAGAYGKTALLAVIGQGAEGWQKYADGVANATGIEAMAAKNAATYSAQMEALGGNIETLKIRIGTEFLPILTEMVGGFKVFVDIYGPFVVRIFKNIAEKLSPLVGLFTDVTEVFRIFNKMIGDNADPLRALQIALNSVFGKDAGDAFVRFMDKVSPIWEGIKTGAEGVRTWLATNGPLMWEGLKTGFTTVQTWIDTNGPGIATSVETFVTAASKWIHDEPWDFLQTEWSKWTTWWVEDGPLITEAVRTVFEEIGEILFGAGEDVGALQKIYEGLEIIIGIAMEGIRSTLTILALAITGNWEGILAEMEESAGDMAKVVAETGGFQRTLIEGQEAGWIEFLGSVPEKAPELVRVGGVLGEALYGGIFEGVKGSTIEENFTSMIIPEATIGEMKQSATELGLTYSTAWMTSFSDNAAIAPAIQMHAEDPSILDVFKILGYKVGETLNPIMHWVGQESGGELNDSIASALDADSPTFKTSLETFFSKFGNFLFPIGQDLGTEFGEGLGDHIIPSLEAQEETIRTGAKKALQSPMQFVMDEITENTKTSFGKNLSGAVKGVFDKVKAVSAGVLTGITTTVTTTWATIFLNTTTAGTLLKEYLNITLSEIELLINTSMMEIIGSITESWASVQEVTESSWLYISDFLTVTWGALLEASNATWESIKLTIVTVVDYLKVWLDEQWNLMKDGALLTWEEFNLGVEEKLYELYATVQELIQLIVKWINDYDLREIGKKLIDGMIEGIHIRAEALVHAMQNAIEAAINAGKSMLGEHSPSTVFRDIFKNVIAGAVMGLEKGENSLVNAMSSIMGSAVSTGKSSMSGLASSRATSSSQVYNSRSNTSIDRSRTIQVEINPTYTGTRNPQELRFDIEAALAGAYL